jgi:hypothetical protein
MQLRFAPVFWYRSGDKVAGTSVNKQGAVMKVMKSAKSEKEFLSPVKRSASTVEIRDGIIAKAKACVDHLCGCTKN